MRFFIPPKKLRTEAVGLLRDFYHERDDVDFHRAMTMLCDFYKIPLPRLRWRRTIEHGDTLALTHTDNLLELIEPAWYARRPPPDNTEDSWVETVLHELFHVVHFVQDEQKADKFAHAMLVGVN